MTEYGMVSHTQTLNCAWCGKEIVLVVPPLDAHVVVCGVPAMNMDRRGLACPASQGIPVVLKGDAYRVHEGCAKVMKEWLDANEMGCGSESPP